MMEIINLTSQGSVMDATQTETETDTVTQQKQFAQNDYAHQWRVKLHKLRSRLDTDQRIRLRVRIALDWRIRFGELPTVLQLDRILPMTRRRVMY